MRLNHLVFTKKYQLTLWACTMGFLSYLFYYPFRRAYAATTFDGIFQFGLPFKTLIIIAQVFGFAFSKWIGVKFISTIKPQKRLVTLVLFALFSTVCMLLFAIMPNPYSLIFIFLGSLPLGMFYGIIMTYLEGRQITEFLVATLTASFIIGSGFSKTLGKILMSNANVPEQFVPFLADCIMFLPLVLVLWLLNFTPPPTVDDIESRTLRPNMNAHERQNFVQKLRLPILLFVVSYCILTAFRELRDNFLPEILNNLKLNEAPSYFTKIETPIAMAVILVMVFFSNIRNNKKAFLSINWLMLLGGAIIGVSTFLFQKQLISPTHWLILLGFGVYLAYALCNSLYFERMIAALKEPSSVGFLITLADFYAYFGTIFVLLFKHFFAKDNDFASFFIHTAYVTCLIYMALVIVNIWFFKQKWLN